MRDLHQMKLVLRTSGSWHVAKTSCQESGCSCGWGWSSPHQVSFGCVFSRIHYKVL